MISFTVSLPLSIEIPRKTKPPRTWYCNLNQYRNTHFQILNIVKKIFEDQVAPVIYSVAPESLDKLHEKIKVTYKLYIGSKRYPDTMNVVSIVDKFFLDTLVNMRILVDDSCNNVIYGAPEFCGVDPGKGRVEATVEVIS